jgi:hypothetical protein
MPPISLSIVTGPSSLPVVADHAAETTNAPLPRSRVNCRSEAAAQKHREPKKRAPDPKLHPDKPANVREWLEGRMSGIYGHKQVKEKFRTLFKVMQLEKHKRSDHTSLNSTQTGHSTGCTEFGHFIGFRADTLAPTPGHCGTRHSESVWRRPQSDTWSSRSVRFRAAKCGVSGFAPRNAKHAKCEVSDFAHAKYTSQMSPTPAHLACASSHITCAHKSIYSTHSLPVLIVYWYRYTVVRRCSGGQRGDDPSAAQARWVDAMVKEANRELGEKRKRKREEGGAGNSEAGGGGDDATDPDFRGKNPDGDVRYLRSNPPATQYLHDQPEFQGNHGTAAAPAGPTAKRSRATGAQTPGWPEGRDHPKVPSPRRQHHAMGSCSTGACSIQAPHAL